MLIKLKENKVKYDVIMSVTGYELHEKIKNKIKINCK